MSPVTNEQERNLRLLGFVGATLFLLILLAGVALYQGWEPPPLDLTLLQGLHAEDYLDAFERGTEPLASSQGIAWSAAMAAE